MSYITENIWLLSNFNPDRTTIANMKSMVLPWAIERLNDLEQLSKLCPEAIFNDEIEALRRGIEACQKRLQVA